MQRERARRKGYDAIPNGKVFRAVSVGIVKLQDDDAIAAP
jgi:hypothetical protein